jgi:PPP family 3-phenylpropionic acid transporter
MNPRFRLSLRLSLYYAALYSVIGIQLPYWPLYLSSKGLDASEIGQILAATYLTKIISNPLLGHVADRHGGRRRWLISLAVLSLVSTGLFFFSHDFLHVLMVTLLSSATFTAMLPLSDNLTLQNTIRHRLDYGRIRLWGSLSFIVIASAAGLALVDAPRSAILWSCLAGLILTLTAAVQLPEPRIRFDKSTQQPVGALLSNRIFLLFLSTCSLNQVSHMMYYGFATLHWHNVGLSGTMIGFLWGEGVVAEVLLFVFGAKLIARFGPGMLMASGGIAGIIRWTVLATTIAPFPLAAAQLLHAFTFAASHLGAMHFIIRAVPTNLSARAQGIYSAVTTGLVPGVAMLVSGWLYQTLGGHAFLVMSLFSAASWLIAHRLLRDWAGGPILQ